MTQSVDILLESSLASVETAERLVLKAAEEVGIEEEARIRLGLAVHECMVNAIVHGNKYDPGKKVRLQVVPHPDSVEILIADQGMGFVVNDVPDPLSGENLMKASGRGVLLIRAFVDEYEVRQLSPQGMEARLVKYATTP